MAEITVVLPAYNEDENVEKLVLRWLELREKLQEKFNIHLKVAVVNDGSKDNTKQIAKSLEEKFEDVLLINHEVNRGLGVALNTGISYVLDNFSNSDFVCVMDCDNTHDPIYVFDMLEKREKENADVVIASRYEQGSGVKGVSPIRLIISDGARIVFSLILGVDNVRDYTCGYRLYKRDILEKAKLRFGENLIRERGFTCMVELLYKLFACGAVFVEIPFELRYDYKKGKSKMKILKTAYKSINLAFRLKKIKKI